MDERVTDIVSEVRSRLSELHKQNIQNDEIYRKANKIQRELLRDLKCVEKDFRIDLKNGVEEYDFYDEQTLDIKQFTPSWDGKLERKRNQDWNDLSTTGSSYPLWVTIFRDQLYLRPIPASDDLSVTVWAYQTNIINKMDDDIPPETPDICDDAIILGVCAEFDKQRYFDEYLMAKESLRKQFHRKDSLIRQRKSNW